MKTSLNLVILCLLVLLNDCKEKERETRFIDDVTNTYCDFKIGSWWIYKEETTDLIDTLSILNYTHRINVVPELSTFDFEEKIMHTKWSLYSNDTSDYIFTHVRISVDHDDGKGNKSLVTEQSKRSSQWLYYTVDSVGEKGSNGNASIIYESHFDSFFIENRFYYDVRKIKIGTGGGWPLASNYIYWAKNIGRVRFETNKGEIWNLIDYHIVK